MTNELSLIKVKNFWQNHTTKIVLAIVLLYFLGFTIFIAINIKRGIINDEITHFDFSKQFSKTLGIPPELPQAYKYGVYITQSPFIYYWINGRIINLINIFSNSVSDWQFLLILRLINGIYSLGTIIVCYLFSKEFIKNKWLQLLPPFFLSNTIMFVFLSGGVNYDNLTNLFCMAGLLFLARVFNHKPFLTNSLVWMISIALGCLTKYTVLPLALAMSVTWIVFLIKNMKQLFPIQIIQRKKILLGVIVILLIVGNLAIYGHNLIKYHSILPECEDILTNDECELDFYNLRFKEHGLQEKLTILESIRLGYPNPVFYFFQWVIFVFTVTFGIQGHDSYISIFTTASHFAVFIWVFTLSIIKRTRLSFRSKCFIGIYVFYALIVFINNYYSELTYGFKNFAMHGRYLFPVIGILYITLTKALINIPHKIIRKVTLTITLLLYFFTGPLTFIYRYRSVFSFWFVNKIIFK